MAVTLSFGYILPQTGDRGSVWFPALEGNIQQLNDHNHDGINSALITGASISPATVVALASNWTLLAPGIYEQTLNTPPGYGFDGSIIQCVDSLNSIVYSDIVRVSNIQFIIRTNDNTQDVTIKFK